MGFISGLYLKLSIRCIDFWIGWPYGGPILFMVWVRFMGLFSICVESWTRGLERPGSICCILGLWSPIYYIRKKPWTMINNSIIFVELHMRWDGLRVILRPQHLPHSFLQWSYGVDYDCSSLLHESIFHMNLPLLLFSIIYSMPRWSYNKTCHKRVIFCVANMQGSECGCLTDRQNRKVHRKRWLIASLNETKKKSSGL